MLQFSPFPIMAFFAISNGSCKAATPPTHQTLVLENSLVSLEINPSIGRISSFRFHQGANALWINDFSENSNVVHHYEGWTNHGGDKVWIAPQSEWEKYQGHSWPPDISIDGSNWQVKRRAPRRIIVESPASTFYHVKVSRDIQLDDTAPLVRIRTTYTRIHAHDSIVNVWTISQIPANKQILVGLPNKGAPARIVNLLSEENQGRFELESIGNQAVAINFPSDKKTKIGINANWLAAFGDSSGIVQFSSHDPLASYAVGANAILYSALDEGYMELEFLGPAQPLEQGESVALDVCWYLMERQGEGVAELAERIERLAIPAHR